MKSIVALLFLTVAQANLTSIHAHIAEQVKSKLLTDDKALNKENTKSAGFIAQSIKETVVDGYIDKYLAQLTSKSLTSD